MYCSSDDVYLASQLTPDLMTVAAVEAFIKAAEREVDRRTTSTYWEVEAEDTATSGTSTTLVDTSQAWNTNEFQYMYVWIYSGTGIGQMRQILSNTATTLTIDRAWTTNAASGSKYRVIYTATNPYFSDSVDGTGSNIMFTQEYPLQILESLTINSVAVTASYVYQYKQTGKMILSTSAESSYFLLSKPQQVALSFWWGVYPMPFEVKRYVTVSAAIKAISGFITTTYSSATSYTLPEGSVSTAPSYQTLNATLSALNMELLSLTGNGTPQNPGILITYPRIV